jgi:hypothetical protein
MMADMFGPSVLHNLVSFFRVLLTFIYFKKKNGLQNIFTSKKEIRRIVSSGILIPDLEPAPGNRIRLKNN